MESLMTAAAGRPHWGKLHTRHPAYLAACPRFAGFTALRDELDQQRRFGNAYPDYCLRRLVLRSIGHI
jgi:hypothetical protein